MWDLSAWALREEGAGARSPAEQVVVGSGQLPVTERLSLPPHLIRLLAWPDVPDSPHPLRPEQRRCQEVG